MAKEKPNKRWVVRRCGSLSPEAGVTHRSWNYARGYVVSTTTTDELQKMEPWQGQSQGNTSWVGNGEISCYHFCPCLPPAPYPSALPGIQLRRALGSVRAKQETVRQGGTRSGYKPDHNVNRSSHNPCCATIPPFNHLFIQSSDNLCTSVAHDVQNNLS